MSSDARFGGHVGLCVNFGLFSIFGVIIGGERQRGAAGRRTRQLLQQLHGRLLGQRGGPNLFVTRAPVSGGVQQHPMSRDTVGLPPCRASFGTSECYASGVGPTVTRDTLGESSRTQPWPWPLNLCQIVPHHVMLVK